MTIYGLYYNNVFFGFHKRMKHITISVKSFSTKSLVQPPTKSLRRQALQWLAKLHSMFWGSAADEAVKHGCPDMD